MLKRMCSDATVQPRRRSAPSTSGRRRRPATAPLAPNRNSALEAWRDMNEAGRPCRCCPARRAASARRRTTQVADDERYEPEVAAERAQRRTRTPTTPGCVGRSCSIVSSLTPTSTPHDVQRTEPSADVLSTLSMIALSGEQAQGSMHKAQRQSLRCWPCGIEHQALAWP